MPFVLDGNKIKLDDGKIVQGQEGGWYNGRQLWAGTLSQPGQIHSQSNQAGAGQAVSQEVIQQTNPANVAFVNAERAKAGLTPAPTTGVPAQLGQPAQPTPTPTPSTGDTGALGVGEIAKQPTINLPQLYEGLYASSGIRDTEADLTAKTNAYNAQVAKIKDNPYLSEATMTGRISKLDEKFRADTALAQNNIAMKKADVETQLNLQTKQFDINNAQVKLAWDQFNTLLSAGSLDNASGEDIANLTRSTGISSSMIQSAIGVSRKKNEPKVNTQVIQVDDGTNISAVVINQDTGEIINRQIIGASEPKKATGGATKTEIKEQEAQQNQSNAANDARNGATLQQLISHYAIAGGLSVEEIYRLYNSNTSRGQAKESLAQVKQGIFANQKGFKTEAQIKAGQRSG